MGSWGVNSAVIGAYYLVLAIVRVDELEGDYEFILIIFVGDGWIKFEDINLIQIDLTVSVSTLTEDLILKGRE